MRNLRLAMFLAELNGLQLWEAQLWGVDVGNAYLQALTKENSTLWLPQSLKNYKDMFLLCARHSMVQYLGEHVAMTNVLIFSTKSISNLPK